MPKRRKRILTLVCVFLLVFSVLSIMMATIFSTGGDEMGVYIVKTSSEEEKKALDVMDAEFIEDGDGYSVVEMSESKTDDLERLGFSFYSIKDDGLRDFEDIKRDYQMLQDLFEESSEEPTFPGYNPRIHDMMNQTEESNLYDYLDKLQNFENEDGVRTREAGTLGYERAAEWAYNKLDSFGLEVFKQNFSYSGGESTNVIAEHPGTDPELEPITYIIGGHLDSTNQMGQEAPGADDNGSGSALTIEAARVMSQYEFDRTIRFALWGAEEAGLHGSEHYASNIDTEEQDMRGYFNYDMVGFTDENDKLAVTLHGDEQSSWMLDYESAVDEAYDDGINYTYEYGSSETRSDHASFWDEGYNATLAIETQFSDHYHSEDDTLDTLTLPQVNYLTRHAIGTVGHLAEPGAEPPSVEVTSPQAGETWDQGTTQTIEWNTEQGENPIDSVDIEYSLDGGESYENIATGIDDTGSYDWEVPDVTSDQAMIRVTTSDTEGFSGSGSSGAFTLSGTPPEAPENLNVGYTGGTGEVVENGIFESDYEPWTLTEEVSEGEASWDSESYQDGGSIYVGAEQTGDGTTTEEAYWEQDIIPTSNTIEVDGAFRKNIELEDSGCSVNQATSEILVHDSEIGWESLQIDEANEEGDTGWKEFETVSYEPTGNVDTVRANMNVEAQGSSGLIQDFTATGELWMDNIGVNVTGEGGEEHNLVSWDASPDDTGKVSQYILSRAASQDGNYEDVTTVDADGSTSYEYLDVNSGAADDTAWWYQVYAEDDLDQESDVAGPEQEPGSSQEGEVEITPSGDQEIIAGERVIFDAAAYDEDNNLITDDRTAFEWENATRGVFNRRRAGDYDVTATYNGVTSLATEVTVDPVEADSIEVAPEKKTVEAGSVVSYTAVAYDQYNNEIGDVSAETTWSVEDGANGEWSGSDYTTENAGDWIVTADYNGMTDSVLLTVETGPVDTVELTPSEDQTITSGEKVVFSAVAYDGQGNVIVDNVEAFDWNNAKRGVFYYEEAGEYEVTASYNGVSSVSTTVIVEEETTSEEKTSLNTVSEGNSDLEDTTEFLDGNEVECVADETLAKTKPLFL